MGRTFQESLQKALRDWNRYVWLDEVTTDLEAIETELADPGPERIWYIADAFRAGLTLEQVHALTKIDVWFLIQIEDIVAEEQALRGKPLAEIDKVPPCAA